MYRKNFKQRPKGHSPGLYMAFLALKIQSSAMVLIKSWPFQISTKSHWWCQSQGQYQKTQVFIEAQRTVHSPTTHHRNRHTYTRFFSVKGHPIRDSTEILAEYQGQFLTSSTDHGKDKGHYILIHSCFVFDLCQNISKYWDLVLG